MRSVFSPSIQKLIDKFSKFPTIGPKTAARFVFYLLKKPKTEIDELAQSILNLKNNIKLCGFCFNAYEGESNLCPICQDPRRDKTLLCVLEKETDLIPIENTGKYKGLYFILGGTVSKFRKTDIENLRIKELEDGIKNPENLGIAGANFQEIIIATNSTPEGEATALYLERLLRPLGKKTTRLGRGLPVGAELEYADEETLSSALEGRK